MHRFVVALVATLLFSVSGSACGGGDSNGTVADAGHDSGFDAGHDAGPSGDAGPSVCPYDGVNYPTAEAFCARYGTMCGFGTTNYYASMAACITSYQAALNGGTADCRTTHACFISTPGASIHCEHSAGSSTCP